MSNTDTEGFMRVVRHIQDEVDFEPEYYNEAYLNRRITARMRRQDVEEYDAYLSILKDDPSEKESLMDSLTINVTNFFRNGKMWEALRPVLRELTSEHRSVKAWSAPCADGREPYSLYMLALDDRQIDESRLSVLGTDISDEALENARAGTYETTRTTDIGEELSLLDDPEQYVDVEGNEFTVKPEVRRQVDFERHDLVQDGPKRNYDLIFCRNLLIYIDSEYKIPVFDTLTSSLKPGGYLVVGMTETVPQELRDDFEAVSKRCRIYKYTPEDR
ncbi:CheR family methyltransferase [Halohasta salina]|uniref:CheR family methyltransferase n=1 Tax=Halohasta salina TaxID=2961621 RepID=UPI0026E589D9|nr:protein-glutamate O-methyltransferase CheR [Halohasta salina]